MTNIYACTENIAVLQYWKAVHSSGEISRPVSADPSFDLTQQMLHINIWGRFTPSPQQYQNGNDKIYSS